MVLGIGIGSATAVFTVLYDAILKPLPYLSADQLVYVHNEFPQAQLARTGESGPDFADLTTHHEIFSNTAAYFFNDFTMTGTVYAQHVDAVNVSASLFQMLGIPAKIGRTYTQDWSRVAHTRQAAGASFRRAALLPYSQERTLQPRQDRSALHTTAATRHGPLPLVSPTCSAVTLQPSQRESSMSMRQPRRLQRAGSQTDRENHDALWPNSDSIPVPRDVAPSVSSAEANVDQVHLAESSSRQP